MLWGIVASKQTKYIFVTGGVLSGLGKGITSAAIGHLLKARGFSVNIQKCDPYLNTDAGTLNPGEHGEVFVTKDGAETDLDLGHYERFLDQELERKSSLMSGRIYANIIAAEREGKYLGKTVQIIPHVTGEIQRQIEASGTGFDIHIVEIGGTVGDYESLGFLEAIRQFKRRVGSENTLYAHLVYLPYISTSKELKTKPAQNTVRDLREAGIQPEIIFARAERPVDEGTIRKLSLFCDVDQEGIIALPNVESVYEIPFLLEAEGFGSYVCKHLGLPHKKPQHNGWEKLVKTIKAPHPTIRVGVVAKYMSNVDTYMSVFEAAKAAGWASEVSVELKWIEAEKLEDEDDLTMLSGLDGIIVPGGFGSRGIEGKIKAASYAIDNQLPYLGLCLGMQTAVVALGRRALGTDQVNTTEVDPKTKHPIIDIMADQKGVADKGGTMRLGNYPCKLKTGTLSRKLYAKSQIQERHRHRYELNNAYRPKLEKAGLVMAGVSPNNRLVELIELKDHPFFVASQFHPEFKSRPHTPHPLFDGFIQAAIRHYWEDRKLVEKLKMRLSRA